MVPDSWKYSTTAFGLKKATFLTSSTPQTIKITWENYLLWTTTCPKPCHSKGVKSLKSGTLTNGSKRLCLTFQKNLWSTANPMSSCWKKVAWPLCTNDRCLALQSGSTHEPHNSSNSTASESGGGPPNRVNQSKKALEWLNWCDYQLHCQGLDSLTAEDLEAHSLMVRAFPGYPHPTRRYYIRQVGNQGECHVLGTSFNVDGFHHETFTVYQLHGRFW